MSTATEPPATVQLDKSQQKNAAGFTHQQIMRILVGLLLGMFLAALDQTVVSTAIRTIGDDLHDLSAQAWVTTAFLITSTIATPLYGKLSDIYGRKPFFMAAITIFIIGSAACAFATSMYMLAAFRAFQGIGAGGLFTLALAIVGDIIPARERAKYQGYFLAVFGTSSVLGPVVGGALAGQSSILGFSGWRWIFLINVPIAAAALWVVYRNLNLPHTRREGVRIDYAGAVSLAVALVPLLIVAEQGRTWGWGSVDAFVCYAIGVIGLVAFLLFEKRAGDSALLPLRLFKIGPFAVGASQSFVVGVGMFGAITLIPLYLQIVKGASPTKAGLLTLPLVLGIMAASVIAGQITSRTGRYKIFPIIGCVLLVTGMLLLWQLGADSSLVYADLAMAVVGLGLGMNMQTIVLAMQNAVGPQDIGVATSSTTFFRQMGGTLGVAVFLSILYSVLPTRTGSAYDAAKADPAFQSVAGTADGQKVLDLVQSGAAFNDTSLLNSFPKVLTDPFKIGFSNSMDLVFLVGAAVLAVAFFLSLLLKEVPLRTTVGQASAPEQTPAREGVDDATAAAAGTGTTAPATTATAEERDRATSVAANGHDQLVGPEGGRHEIVDDAHAVRVEDLVSAVEADGRFAHGAHEAPVESQRG
ncbi:MDR family MFS transporter [Jatrophihabitans sp. YIM 134969]